MADGPAVRIHHINCGTLCPHGARLLQGEGGLLDRARLVCHCLAIESADGVILVDTGFGSEDVEHPRQLGRPFLALTSPRLRREDTALARLAELGLEAGDVRHIVVTHLDPDHSGGLPDFPEAEVHVFATEHAAAMNPKLTERSRYVGAHWSHQPNWVTHETAGDEWHGFESVRVLPGSDPEVLLVPLIGHSRGHTGVAVRSGEGVAAPLRGLLLLPRRDRDPAPLPTGAAALPDDQPGGRPRSPREPGAPAGARPPRRGRPSPLLLA